GRPSPDESQLHQRSRRSDRQSVPSSGRQRRASQPRQALQRRLLRHRDQASFRPARIPHLLSREKGVRMNGARDFGLTIGVVKKREDPDKLGRVKLTLPEYGDRETDWTRIAFPLAGKTSTGAHGAYSIPEVGDEVIVGFRQDSRDVIALGFTYSKQRKPPVTN